MKRAVLFVLSLITVLAFVACESRFGTRSTDEAGPLIPTKADQPLISPASGSHPAGTLVTITTGTEGAIIKYTTDGSTPDKDHGNTYGGQIELSTNQIKAIAVKDGLDDSDVATADYTVQAPYSPVFSPVSGVYYANSINVALSVSSGDYDEIKYSTDPAITPAANTGGVYSTPITVNKTNTTVWAVSVKSGVVSGVNSATYILKVTAPTVTHSTCLAMPSPGGVVIPSLESTKVDLKKLFDFNLIDSLEAGLPPDPLVSVIPTTCSACVMVSTGTPSSTVYWRYKYLPNTGGAEPAPVYSAWTQYTGQIHCDDVEAMIPVGVTNFYVEAYATKTDMTNSDIGTKYLAK